MKYYLGVGLASVDPQVYNGWSGNLGGTIPDVKLFESQLKNYQYQTKLLLTKDATWANMTKEIGALVKKAVAGDTIVIAYSGHGGQIWDSSHDETDTQYDSTWCLYDMQVIDDLLWEQWCKFKKGVRLFIFSDSCHSGTAYKSAAPVMMSRLAVSPKIQCTLKFFGGCSDEQTSADLGSNGLFTKTLFNILWAANGKMIPKDLAAALKKKMPQDQQPTYKNEGPQILEWDLKPIFT